MADKKNKGTMYDISLDSDKVRAASIKRYKNGYSYATITFSPAENEYMNINYEWEGDSIPEFAMNVMDIMKAFNKEKASTFEEVVDYYERAADYFLNKAKNLRAAKDSDKE